MNLLRNTPHEVDVTSSNPPSPLLYGHIKKKKMFRLIQMDKFLYMIFLNE
jgi:hypothetical protein